MGGCFEEGTFPGCSSYQSGTMGPGAQAIGGVGGCVCVCVVCVHAGDLKPCEIEDRDPERWEEVGEAET